MRQDSGQEKPACPVPYRDTTGLWDYIWGLLPPRMLNPKPQPSEIMVTVKPYLITSLPLLSGNSQVVKLIPRGEDKLSTLVEDAEASWASGLGLAGIQQSLIERGNLYEPRVDSPCPP